MSAEKVKPQQHVKIRAGELTLYTCPVADGEAVLEHAVELCPFCKGPLE